MLSAAHPTVMRWHARIGPPLSGHLGRLLTPRDYARANETLAAGIPVGVDNRAFVDWQPTEFVRMLEAIAGLPVAWCASPDVVGDAAATDERWIEWASRIREYGLPVAYVAQDGWRQTPADADAVFIGGSDTFKDGPAGELVVRDALERGLWVHGGRVNTPRRAAYMASLGATSFDGTQFSRWSATHLHNGLRLAAAPPPMRFAV